MSAGGTDRKNRHNVVSSLGGPKSNHKRSAVGVDLRLVIIASLVVAMLLIQVILVETYSTKRTLSLKSSIVLENSPTFSPSFLTGGDDKDAPPQQQSATNEDEDTSSLFEETPSPSMVIESNEEKENEETETKAERTTPSPTQAKEQVDIEKLEKQLKELQDIQEDEDEELLEPAPPPRPDLLIITPPPIVQHIPAQDRESEPIAPVHHSSSSSSSSVTTSKEHHHHSRSSSHVSRACKARRHVFRSYKNPPRIVCFVHDKTDSLDPLWREAFRDLGYQETQNPSLATFLMARHGSESKAAREICPDSQVFNHIKSTRALTNPVSLSKAVLKHSAGASARFFPEVALYGGFSSSTSYTTKKSACAHFMVRAQDFLRMISNERNTFLTAFVEKHDKTVAKLSLTGLKKVLDAHKKSGTCPHSDDIMALQLFKNVFVSPMDQKLCALRALVYIPTLKPLMAFVAPRAIAVRCSPANRGEINVFENFTTDFASGMTLLAEFKERLVHEGRFPTQESASVAFQELISKLKRAVGELVVSARSKLEILPGRFGLISADFVLDAYSLQPILVKMTDVPPLTIMERKAPGLIHSLLFEVIRSQHYLAQRAWASSGGVLRPERLRSLSSFELVMYEMLVSGGSSKDSADHVVSMDHLLPMSTGTGGGASTVSTADTWVTRIFPFP